MDSDEGSSTADKLVKEHVPPIKVLAHRRDYVHKLLTNKGIVKYRLKRMSIGSKKQCETMVIYSFVKTILSENNCQFLMIIDKKK